MARSYTYHGVTVSRKLNADEQRSLAMRLRNFGVKYGVRIAESIAPVEVTSPPKLTVVKSAPVKAKPVTRPTITQKQIDEVIASLGLTPDEVKAVARTGRVIVKAKADKEQTWEDLKASWTETREAGIYTCACDKVFASLGSAEKGGALFHKAWTKDKGIYGKGKDHFIPTIK